MNETNAKGYTCECGKYHEYPAYVYAHWDEELFHSCDCGRRHSILRGHAELAEQAAQARKPKRKAKAK